MPVHGLSGVSTLNLSPLPLLTMVLLYGTGPATVTAWVTGAIATRASQKGGVKSDLVRLVLNSSKKALCVLVAGWILWGSQVGRGIEGLPGPGVLLRLVIAHGAYFSISTWLLSFGLWLRDGRDPLEVWRANFGWGALVSWSTPLGAYLLALFYVGGGSLLIAILIGVGLLGIYVVRDHVRITTSFLRLVDALRLARDGNLPHLKGETEKVTSLAVKLAHKMHLPSRNIQLVEKSATLHNVGYIALDRDTILKPAKLTDAEMGEIKAHPESGMRIIKEVEGLDEVAEIVHSHHESPDGTGYPRGLTGNAIPLEAAIVKVAEAYVAMTSHRPHRPRPLTHEEALETIAEDAGKSLDPAVAYHFLEMMNRADLAERISQGFGPPRRALLVRRLMKPRRQRLTILPQSTYERHIMLKGLALLTLVVALVAVFQMLDVGTAIGASRMSELGLLGGMFFLCLLGLASLKPVRLPQGAYVSASSAVVIAAAVIGGPIYATLFALATIGWALIHNPQTALAHSGQASQPLPSGLGARDATKANQPPYLNGGITSLIKTKSLATRLSPATSHGLVLLLAGVAAWGANWLGERVVNVLGISQGTGDLPPFILAAGAFYLVETSLSALLLSRDGLSPIRLWQRNYIKTFPEPLTYAVCGYAIYLGYRMLGLWATLPLFLFPTLWRHVALLRRLELLRMRDSLIRAIARTIDEKDRYTGGHSGSVVELSVAIAREMGLSERFVEELEEAAIRHDLGKVAWPNQVLRKPARLNEHEEETYKLTHPDVSAEIARRAGSSERVCNMIKYHHERWDGKGYPHGLSGEAIPTGARILCVADSFDAMIHDRWYRRKRTLDDALEELVRCSGTQFDPQVVEAFMRLAKRIDLEQFVGRVEAEVKITPPQEQPAQLVSQHKG